MPELDEEKKASLLKSVKAAVAEKQFEDFQTLMAEEYIKTITESKEEPITYGSYELGFYDVMETVTYEVNKKFSYFNYDDNRELLQYALEQNNLEVLDWFKEQGYGLKSKKFELFCNNNLENNDPLVEQICNTYLSDGLNHNHFNYTRFVITNSPHLKNNLELAKRLDAIKPLFSELNELEKIQKYEIDSNNNDSAEKLNDYANAVRCDIKKFITGQSNGPAFLNSAQNKTNKAMLELEENSEGMKIFKNILLTLSVIGPVIKKLTTGEWFFENSTTAKVREMKESLTKIKFFNKEPEPEALAENENLPQAVGMSQ